MNETDERLPQPKRLQGNFNPTEQNQEHIQTPNKRPRINNKEHPVSYLEAEGEILNLPSESSFSSPQVNIDTKNTLDTNYMQIKGDVLSSSGSLLAHSQEILNLKITKFENTAEDSQIPIPQNKERIRKSKTPTKKSLISKGNQSKKKQKTPHTNATPLKKSISSPKMVKQCQQVEKIHQCKSLLKNDHPKKPNQEPSLTPTKKPKINVSDCSKHIYPDKLHVEKEGTNLSAQNALIFPSGSQHTTFVSMINKPDRKEETSNIPSETSFDVLPATKHAMNKLDLNYAGQSRRLCSSGLLSSSQKNCISNTTAFEITNPQVKGEDLNLVSEKSVECTVTQKKRNNYEQVPSMPLQSKEERREVSSPGCSYGNPEEGIKVVDSQTPISQEVWVRNSKSPTKKSIISKGHQSKENQKNPFTNGPPLKKSISSSKMLKQSKIDEKLLRSKSLPENYHSKKPNQKPNLTPTKNQKINEIDDSKQIPPEKLHVEKERTNLSSQNALIFPSGSQHTSLESMTNKPDRKEETSSIPSETSFDSLPVSNYAMNKLDVQVKSRRLSSYGLISHSQEIHNSNTTAFENSDSQIEDEDFNLLSKESLEYTDNQKKINSFEQVPLMPLQLERTEILSPRKSYNNLEKQTKARDNSKITPISQNHHGNNSKTPCENNAKTKESHNEEKQNTPKKVKPRTKENTAHGDEYQRIIQILVRHRGSKMSSFKLGTEVSDLGYLDDLVCVSPNGCRFIQVKHSTLTTKNLLSELFKTDCHISQRPKYELALYLNSFCKIKKNQRFNNCEIEEITILTNVKLFLENETDKSKKPKEERKLEEFLIKRNNFESDNLLFLKGGSGIKYFLNVNALKKCNKIMDILQKIYSNHFETKPEMANEIITEYLEKVCIIVDYPDVRQISDLVFPEIFQDQKPEIVHLLKNSLIHAEVENLLTRRYQRVNKNEKVDEFLSNEEWKKRIDEVKKFIELTIVAGITNYNTHKLLNSHERIIFDEERIKDMYDDISTFLSHDEVDIFHCSKVQDEKLVAIKALIIMKQLKEKRNKNVLFGENIVSYAEVYSLLDDKYLTDHFLAGSINTLVITTGTNQGDDDKVHAIEELATKLVNGVKNQKIILISASENIFTEKVKVLSDRKYSEKFYNHDFSCLTQTSRKHILDREVSFQGKLITFGALFNNNLNFAINIIDERVMMKMTDKEEKICIMDVAAFKSPGYNENYYISRELYQKRVCFSVIKEKMKEELFFITPKYRMDHSTVLKVLKQNGIDKQFIWDWAKNSGIGKRKTNGIVLRGLSNDPNEKIFREITKKNTLVHWLLVCDTYLVLLDSNCKLEENKALATMQPTTREEVQFLNSQPLEQLLILAGDSGVGKSTVLTYMANNILNLSSDTPDWIIKVNLRNFYKKKTLATIGDLTQIDSTIDLISDMSSSSDSTKFIARKIIQEGLKKTQKDIINIVLLLDGFNEISSSLQNKTCSFLKTLCSECNIKQIWITTQVQGKVKLENQLETPAYFLEDLSDEKQVNLMVRYWSDKNSSNDPPISDDINELKKIAQRALQTWKKSINDKDEQSFTQVSLNVIILSEIIFNNGGKIPEEIHLCSLYETFIHKRFSIYNEETSEPNRQLTEVDHVKEKLFRNSIKEILQEQSVRMIFTTYKNNIEKKIEKKLPNMDALDRFKSSITDLQYNGIEVNYHTILSKIDILSVKKEIDYSTEISLSKKEEIDFTHESFAQFFFSEYLVNNLNNDTLKKFFVNHVLSENHLYLCRKFLNNLIKKHFKTKDYVLVNRNDYNIFKPNTISLSDKYIKVITTKRAVSKIAEEKLDYIIILLLNIMSKNQCAKFLEQWVKDEQFCSGEEESVKKILLNQLEEEKVRLPRTLRKIIMINKSQEDVDTKLNMFLQIPIFSWGDESQETL